MTPVEFVARHAEALPGPVRVILFGSRARQDHHERSDYDIAVSAPQLSDDAWAIWAGTVREQFPSLCGLDLVRLTKTTKVELCDKIRSEGVVIHEH